MWNSDSQPILAVPLNVGFGVKLRKTGSGGARPINLQQRKCLWTGRHTGAVDPLPVAQGQLPAIAAGPGRVRRTVRDRRNDRRRTAADGATIKDGSYFIDKAGRLMQIVKGAAATVAVEKGSGGAGITPKSRPDHPRPASYPG